MRVERAGESEKKKESAYKEVDNIDLSEESGSWTFEKKVEGINITKEAQHRESVIRISFTEKDIIALYEGLIKGWQQKLDSFEEIQSENKELKNKLFSLWIVESATQEVLRYAKKEGIRQYEINKLESIISYIDRLRSK